MALADFEAFLATPGAKTDEQVVAAMTSSGVGAADVARLVGLPVAEVSARVGAVREASFLSALMAPNITDAQVVQEINRIGITPERVSALTNVPLAEITRRIAATRTNQEVFTDFLMQPNITDAQIASEMRRLGITNQQTADLGGLTLDEVNRRFNALSNEDQFRASLMTPNLTDAQIVSEMARLGITNQQTADLGGLRLDEVNRRVNALSPRDMFAAYLMTPNLTDAQIAAEMGRLGITNRTVSDITGLDVSQIEDRINATSGTMPFANATQAFTQDFNNFQSIPIGAQFNPNVVGGTGSPYSQIMAQMRPVGNPYATARSGLAMGGYDPGIYDADLLDRVRRERAGNLATTAGTGTSGPGGDGPSPGGDGPSPGGVGGAGGPGSTSAANPADFGTPGTDSVSPGNLGETADPGGMFGGAQSGDVGFFKGGLIGRVFGTDPAGPDEGQINVQRGEYVVRKSAVKKYGKGLLDMINDGKIPAKKIRSLLD